jgi:hypothetical protein
MTSVKPSKWIAVRASVDRLRRRVAVTVRKANKSVWLLAVRPRARHDTGRGRLLADSAGLALQRAGYDRLATAAVRTGRAR